MAADETKFKGDLLHERQAGAPSTLRQILFHLRVLRAGWGLLLFSTVFVGCVLAESLFIEHFRRLHSMQSWYLAPHDILNPLIALVAVIAATITPSLLEQRRTSTYGLRGHPWKNLLTGVATGGALVVLTYFAMRLARLVTPDARHATGMATLKYSILWACIFAMFALLEELLTRGYLQYTLTRGLAFLYRRFLGLPYGVGAAFWTSAVLTSLLFVWLYSSNLGQTQAGLAGIFTMGMLYCWSLWRTGSLWWALGFHAAWDYVQGFVFMQWDGGLPIRDHFFAWVAREPLLWSGGHAGLDGSLLVYPVLALAFASLLLLPRHKVYPELWELARVQHAEGTSPDPDRI